MEDHHRDYIKKSMEELIQATKYTELINACLCNRLISNTMFVRIDGQIDVDEHEKHKQLFEKITRRGPTAYDELIKILVQLKYSQAVNILRAPKFNNSEYISMHNPATIQKNMQIEEDNQIVHLPEGCYPSNNDKDSKKILKLWTEKIKQPEGLEVIKSNKIQSKEGLPSYPMKSKKRGVLFVVNIKNFPKSENEYRAGSETDVKTLLYLFQELGFICFSYEDLTRVEFFELFDQLRNSHYLKETESFVLALMSHGERTLDNDYVEFYDGSVCRVQDIEDFLSNTGCLSLVNKPKVLILPFCRGPRPDKGSVKLQTDSISSVALESLKIPTRSDIMLCYGSVRGFKTFRDKDNGSWYVQTFCKVVASNAHNTDLEIMLKQIGEKVQKLRSSHNYLQTPGYDNHGFNKFLFFNPGVYDE